ncbi:MAG TPA: response regulator [Chloroflexota bacterium]|nr:response regulator [Chloroflexota bacterium]
MRDDRRMVLVVEDDPPLRRMIGIFLRAAGYLVCAAEDGSRGLALARDERPDLMLLDLMLPGLDGWEVLRRIKGDALTAAIPVLVLTASADLPFTEQALLLGATNFLTKPIDSRVLVEHVDAVVGQTAGQEEHA